VTRVNWALDKDESENPYVIGVLDSFGFEDMTINGFEQLFINTTNEMLQKVFNDIIFKEEAEEYTREQIDWDPTSFPDNEPCIDLLTRRPIGLMPYLDSECARGAVASDGAELVRKLNKSHASNEFFEVCGPASVYRRKDQSRTQHEDFLIRHYAGPIIYTVTDFIVKNRDALLITYTMYSLTQRMSSWRTCTLFGKKILVTSLAKLSVVDSLDSCSTSCKCSVNLKPALCVVSKPITRINPNLWIRTPF
jgi:myosin heavy subunit